MAFCFTFNSILCLIYNRLHAFFYYRAVAGVDPANAFSANAIYINVRQVVAVVGFC